MIWGLEDTSREGLSKFLSDFNLEMVEHISSKEVEETFMTNIDSDVVGTTPGHAFYVIARVP